MIAILFPKDLKKSTIYLLKKHTAITIILPLKDLIAGGFNFAL